MKVSELIAFLEDCDENAEVLFVSQPHWPFEYSVRGAFTREDLADADDDEDGEDAVEQDGDPTDVILVEGSQLRYGRKAFFQ